MNLHFEKIYLLGKKSSVAADEMTVYEKNNIHTHCDPGLQVLQDNNSNVSYNIVAHGHDDQPLHKVNLKKIQRFRGYGCLNKFDFLNMHQFEGQSHYLGLKKNYKSDWLPMMHATLSWKQGNLELRIYIPDFFWWQIFY